MDAWAKRVNGCEVIGSCWCRCAAASSKAIGPMAARGYGEICEPGDTAMACTALRGSWLRLVFKLGSSVVVCRLIRGSRPESSIAANILNRQFSATAPNQRWVADFTYIWTDQGWLYFAVVLDLFSRRIVGWSMSAEMTAQLVTDALVMAIWRRGRPRELLHHSDQGSQYTSEQFQRLLTDQGITCSMSRSGNVWDNSAMESFFSSLQIERVHRRIYATREEAKADLFDYVERFYNPRRRHSTLGYLSPADYENTAGSA